MVVIPMSDATLTSILELIGLNQLSWSILHVWAVSNSDSGINILELEENAKNVKGMQIGWSDLVSLSGKLDQVNECTIVGVTSKTTFPDRDLPLEVLKKLCDVVIEAVDSTNWEISAKDGKILRNLKRLV